MIMYVVTFKTNVILFIGNVIIFLTSHWQIIFGIRVSSPISLSEIKGTNVNKLLIKINVQ
jgi:hypothetical protein